jgi:hypothetical protein
MSDVFTPEERSEVMSRIRGRDTKLERIIRSMLHRIGHQAFVVPPFLAFVASREVGRWSERRNRKRKPQPRSNFAK